ncbi:hypothetical protein Tco_1147862 [Tanacetum coccineum]
MSDAIRHTSTTRDSYMEERIEMTKRSKNDQKPTRNGKKTKSQEQEWKISQRSKPDQPDTAGKKVKGQNKVKRLVMTSSQSLKALFEVLEIKGLSLSKEKS